MSLRITQSVFYLNNDGENMNNYNLKILRLFIIMQLFINAIHYNNYIHAKIITVDNKIPYSAQYSSLQEAHDNANNDDIIYLSPSSIRYEGIIMTKRLSIYGVGFDLKNSPNHSPYLILTAAIGGTLTFDEGSDGSIVDGVEGNFSVIIQASNITIRRTNLNDVSINKTNLSGITLINNYLTRIVNSYSYSEINLLNNLIEYYSYGANTIVISGDNNCIVILNNIVISSYKLFSFKQNTNVFLCNNIVYSINGDSTDCRYGNFEYNLFVNTSLNNSISNTNIKVENIDDVFQDFNNKNYDLKDNSLAITSGRNGEDMGIYGGVNPFDDFGFPNLPTILSIDSSFVSSKNGLNVIIKAKSN